MKRKHFWINCTNLSKQWQPFRKWIQTKLTLLILGKSNIFRLKQTLISVFSEHVPQHITLTALGCPYGWISQRFLFPAARGPGSFPGTERGNDTDAIVIENKDRDNITFPPFLFRPFPIIPPRTCPKERSCRNRCSRTRQFQNETTKRSLGCFCDPECKTLFHDCCADYEKYCKEPEPELALKSWACGKIVGKKLGIWIIAKCMQNWPQDEVRLKCENNSNEVGKLCRKNYILLLHYTALK